MVALDLRPLEGWNQTEQSLSRVRPIDEAESTQMRRMALGDEVGDRVDDPRPAAGILPCVGLCHVGAEERNPVWRELPPLMELTKSSFQVAWLL